MYLPHGKKTRGIGIVDRCESEHGSAQLTAVLPAVSQPLQEAILMRVPVSVVRFSLLNAQNNGKF